MSKKPNLKKVKTFDFSNPELYNKVYIPLFHNKSRFLHLFGSAGSGKSVFGGQKEIVLTFDETRRGRKTMVVRKVFSTLKNSVFSQLKTQIYEWNLQDCFSFTTSPLTITNKLTGVQFIFFGLDDIEKVKSVAGVDRIIIEEATELSGINELDQLSLRLRGFAEVQITLMYNPVNVYHWINQDIHQKLPEEHFIFKTTYRDNEKLLAKDPHYAPNIERLKFTNPNYYKVYGKGEWGQNSEGLIYPNYESKSEMPPVQFYGLDFGYNDPSALVAGAVSDNFESDKKDFFVQELIYESNLSVSDLIGKLETVSVNKWLPIIADSSQPGMIEDIRRAGYNIKPCTKYKGSVVDGINNVKKYNLKIIAGSKNIFKEVENYSWQEKDGKFRDDEPVDAINHASDAFRYGLETQIVQQWGVERRNTR